MSNKVMFVDFKKKTLNKVVETKSKAETVKAKPLTEALRNISVAALDLDSSLNSEGYMNYPGFSRRDVKKIEKAIKTINTLNTVINLLDDQREVLFEQLNDAGVEVVEEGEDAG